MRSRLLLASAAATLCAALAPGREDAAIRNAASAPRHVVAHDLNKRAPGHPDFERLRHGSLGAQLSSVWVPAENPSIGCARVRLEQVAQRRLRSPRAASTTTIEELDGAKQGKAKP